MVLVKDQERRRTTDKWVLGLRVFCFFLQNKTSRELVLAERLAKQRHNMDATEKITNISYRDGHYWGKELKGSTDYNLYQSNARVIRLSFPRKESRIQAQHHKDVPVGKLTQPGMK